MLRSRTTSPLSLRRYQPDQVPRVRLNRPRAYRAASKDSAGGFQNEPNTTTLATETAPDEVRAELERRWAWGGFRILSAFADTGVDLAANRIVQDFVAEKIRAQVADPAVADQHRHPVHLDPHLPHGPDDLAVTPAGEIRMRDRRQKRTQGNAHLVGGAPVQGQQFARLLRGAEPGHAELKTAIGHFA